MSTLINIINPELDLYRSLEPAYQVHERYSLKKVYGVCVCACVLYVHGVCGV